MTDDRLEPAAGEQTTQITILLTGTLAQIDKAAREITQVCDRAGARYVIERRKPSSDEPRMFEGEHRL